MSTRQRYPRSFWIETNSDFEMSGLSLRDFCARRGIVKSTFENWRRKLRREKALPAGLVRVEQVEPPATALIEAVLRCGVCLRFQSSVHPGYVAALIGKLDGDRC